MILPLYLGQPGCTGFVNTYNAGFHTGFFAGRGRSTMFQFFDLPCPLLARYAANSIPFTTWNIAHGVHRVLDNS